MKHSEGSRLIKNSVMILINNFFMLAVSWAISIWVARELGPSNYGIFNLVMWVTGAFVWILGMGLIHAVTKFIAEYKGKNENGQPLPIILFVLKTELLLSIPITLVLVFFRTQISDFFFTPNESVYFFLMFLGIIPGLLTAIFSAAIEGIQKFEYFTIANLVIAPVSFTAKALVLYMGKGITGLLVVMLIFSIVNALFYFFILRHEGVFRGRSKNLKKDIKERIVKYNKSVLSIILIDKIVWDKSENFFLGRYSSSLEIGFYNLGYNVAQKFITIVPNTFWRVLFPAMSNYCGSGEKDKMRRLFYVSVRYLAFFSFPVGAAGAALSFNIIKFLYGYEYLDAQRVMQIIFLVSMVSSLSNPASAILYGYEKQSFILKYGSVLAVMNIVLNFYLIRNHGALGAAISFGAITLLGAVGGLIYTCRTMKLTFPFVPLSKILLSTIIMSIVIEIVSGKDGSLLGFLAAIAAGTVTYLACSFSLGSFGPEDMKLLKSSHIALPGKSKILLDVILKLIAKAKHSEKDCEKEEESEILFDKK